MKIKELEDLTQAEFSVTLGGQTMIVSVFFIDGMLIDTGPRRQEKLLTAFYDNLEIEKVVLTHHHEDHSGLAYWLQSEKEIPIYIHPIGVEICKKKAKLPLYRHLFWGKREAFQAESIEKIFQTENYVWEVLHTPGHAEDHIALYNKKKGWMFGGDLYVHPQPKSSFKFESIPDMIKSLHKVLKYDFETYICSHQGIIFDGKKAVQKKLDYLISLQQEILFLYNKGMTPREIRKELFPKRHMMHYLSFFENSPMHFIHSVVGKAE